MPRIKLTAKGIDALLAKPHPTRIDYFDLGTAALSLRVGPRSATWYYTPRINGKLTRLALGECPTMGLHAARAAVAKAEADIDAGKHPKAEQARERTAKRVALDIDEGRVVRNVADAWAKHHFPTLGDSTRADYQRALDRFVGTFGDDDVGTLRRGQLVRYLDGVLVQVKANKRAKSGSAANHAAVVIRQLFAYAADRLDLDANPAADIKNPAKPKASDRSLDRHEIRILWRACEKIGYPYGHALRFALCTGQRIGEVGDIRRTDIDSTGDYWIQTKNKKKRRIDPFLGGHAQAILADCPEFATKHPPYFSCAGKIGIASNTWQKPLKRIRAAMIEAAKELRLPAVVEHWTPHALRHTVRTGLTGWCGVSPDVAERVINHALIGLRATYDHADYRPHVADALHRWDDELTRILKGSAPAIASLATARRAKQRKLNRG